LGHKKVRKNVGNFPIIRRFLSWYARCLESDVHNTKASHLLFLLSGSKSFRHCLVLFLALAVTSVFGQGSVLTLAMVRYDQSPARTPAATRNYSAASLLCYDASAPRLQYRVAALKLDNQYAPVFSSNSRLEKQSYSNQRDLIPLVHTKLYADGRTGKWMDVAAGYGQVCQHESGIAESMAELERPSRAYLKASFSF
jgi:hypothetical protein